MRIARFLLPAVLVIFAACKKDKSGDSGAFLPGKSGSTWTYSFTEVSSGASVSYTLTATNRDSVINAKRYRVYTVSGNRDNEYYGRLGNDYFQFANFAGIGTTLEMLYLKSNLPKGGTWEETKPLNIPGVGTVNARLAYEIADRGISHTVGSLTFPNTTRVRLALTFQVPGIPIPIVPTSDINLYFAEGVGRVQSRVKISLNQAPFPVINNDTDERLTSYNILP